ncbi:MAG: hypothetical protein DDT34_02491 [Firmicutes bacterium]|nr:hypothetical protein [Bacillota bacterium]
MDQCGDGSRTGHGVGQPDVEGNLRALAGCGDKHQKRDPEGDVARQAAALVQDDAVVQTANKGEAQEDGDEEGEVAHPVGYEGFLRGGGLLHVGKPEPDEEVGAGAHTFPA